VPLIRQVLGPCTGGRDRCCWGRRRGL